MNSEDITACAEIVAKADPARFRAAMAAPLGLRERLLVLYAFNAEVARAPWVTDEPMIAEMRLQWWHDALAEVAAGQGARRHEVVTPLAEMLSADEAAQLQGLVAARRWDIYEDGFADEAALWAHLGAGTGALMEVALRQAGHEPSQGLQRGLEAMGLANWLSAAAELRARGRTPLPDASDASIVALARAGLARLSEAHREALPKPARQVLLAGWQAAPLLARAARRPSAVREGQLALAPFRARASLALKAALGRW